MTLSDLETIVGKAVSVDFMATKAIVSLLYKTDQEATDAFYALTKVFPFSRELTIHVQYKYNEKIDFSIIAKDTADTIKINDLAYADGKKTYINMNALEGFARTKHNDLNVISFWPGSVSPSGQYNIPYMEQAVKERNPGFNIIGFTTEFIPEEKTS
jgi:hypothetical protein